jgi:hypothetical protein
MSDGQKFLRVSTMRTLVGDCDGTEQARGNKLFTVECIDETESHVVSYLCVFVLGGNSGL